MADTIIGRDVNGDIYIARDFFKYSDGFKGVTGDVVYPVTQEMIEALDKAEYLEDAWREDAGSTNGTELGLDDWADEIPDDEFLDMAFEPADVDVEALNVLTGIDAERYAISGCGRVFSRDIVWETLWDADTLKRVIEWEG